MIYPCADGHVTVLISGGAIGAMIMTAMLGWIDESEGLPDWLSSIDWSTIEFATLADTPDGLGFFERASDMIGAFLPPKTKAALYPEAPRRRVLLATVHTMADLSPTTPPRAD